MKISMIAAIGLDRGLGYKGSLLWQIPEDMQHFKDVTMGHHVVMGQTTYESIGRPLPGRTNIILSKSEYYGLKILEKTKGRPGVYVVDSIAKAIEIAKENGEEELMVIGGASVYEQFMPLADKLYLTQILRSKKADVYFPEIDWNRWSYLDSSSGDVRTCKIDGEPGLVVFCEVVR